MHSVPGTAIDHFLVDFLRGFAEPYASSDASFFLIPILRCSVKIARIKPLLCAWLLALATAAFAQ